jgi:hypothetical protein
VVEARQAGGVLDDDLAVDPGGAEPEAGQRLGDAAEAVGPVEAGAGEELDLAAIDAGLDAVAVLLDLVHPLVAARRPLAVRGEARCEEDREQALLGAAHAVDVG